MVERNILPSPDFTNVVTEIKVDVDRACLAIRIKPEPLEIGFRVVVGNIEQAPLRRRPVSLNGYWFML